MLRTKTCYKFLYKRRSIEYVEHNQDERVENFSCGMGNIALFSRMFSTTNETSGKIGKTILLHGVHQWRHTSILILKSGLLFPLRNEVLQVAKMY